MRWVWAILFWLHQKLLLYGTVSHVFAMQCYIADCLLQCAIFFTASRPAAREVPSPAGYQTCWQRNMLVVLWQKSRLSHDPTWWCELCYPTSHKSLLPSCDATNQCPFSITCPDVQKHITQDSDKRSAYGCKGFQCPGQPSWNTQPLHLPLLLPSTLT